jgi:hypothetical protein
MACIAEEHWLKGACASPSQAADVNVNDHDHVDVDVVVYGFCVHQKMACIAEEHRLKGACVSPSQAADVYDHADDHVDAQRLRRRGRGRRRFFVCTKKWRALQKNIG